MNSASPELVIEVCSADGAAVLGCAPAALGPLFEDAAFRGVLEGRLPNDGCAPQLEIELRLADPDSDRVASVALYSGDAPALQYPWTAFETQAQCLVERLIAEQRLESGARSRWQLRLGAAAQAPVRRPRARLRSAPYPLREVTLADRVSGTFEVAISGSVLDARRERLLGGGSVESAALLLGQLYRDPACAAARLLVLDQVELAPGSGGASRTHFAFDPRCFALALEAARARPDLVPVGWAHDHPPCADCVRQPACASETVFFSTDDYQVHASAFGRAYQVALVAGKLRDLPATSPGFRLYGWDAGRISELPLNLLPDAVAIDRSEA